ncbi:hypothetical protein [Aquabacter spiritensis]|uniref:Uncharacterized protein n=1 Tax=Aquabacter spiritensis TaxID=933073 RepID=A0A4R3LSB5_9HYPH|nr:hypothetical protein [Aquabacter spiritensis]TCT01077.1 hypothetical protein EDC64_11947 [Aquabacter spiritensis]
MSKDQAPPPPGPLDRIPVDPAERRAATDIARSVGALVSAGAAARMTVDETPWSLHTLRAEGAARAAEDGA